MLLTDARRAARTTADGSIVPLDEQHRDLWNTTQVKEGVALLTRTLGKAPVGPYQLQAAMAISIRSSRSTRPAPCTGTRTTLSNGAGIE